MSITVKRRVTERKHPQRSSAKSLTTLGVNGWGDEVLSISSFALAFFLLASLMSEIWIDSAPVSISYDLLADAPRNVMGPVGHVIATILLGCLGWCALVPVIWFLWIGSYFWTYELRTKSLEVSSRFFWIIGFAASLIFSAALAAVIWGKTGGGSIGSSIAQPLTRSFNVSGAALFLFVGLLLSLAVVTRQKVGLLVKLGFIGSIGVITVLLRSALICLGAIAALLVRLTHIVMGGAGYIFSGLGGGRPQERTDNIIPPPRVRKNAFVISVDDKRKPESEGGVESIKETMPPERLDIVVSRKRTDFKLDNQRQVRSVKRAEKQARAETPVPIDYVPPSIELLKKGDQSVLSEDDEELIQTSRQIEAKLRDFSINGRVTQVHPGPVITLYEFEPAPGVKVGRISALQDDLAMSLRAVSIRIIAPIPKRGTVGIEVPNKHREIVRLRDVLESESFANADSILGVPIGKDTYGDPVLVDIAQMPHLLMAGATGTGKSVCINAILLSLLYRATPAELGLILIDPKILELSVYEGIPHLRVPVVTNSKQARAVLDWAVKEMERRYRLMQKYGVRSIDGYNKVVKGESEPDVVKPQALAEEVEVTLDDEVQEGVTSVARPALAQEEIQFQEKLEPLPKIVIVVDELADLMLAVGRDIEELVTRLAQKARAAGIHLIVATQRPSVDVITGLIKANFPARLSFRVTSRIDSRTILDAMGADKLLGRGDMLFMSPGSVHLKRIHGAFVSDDEVKRVIESLKANAVPQYDQRIMDICERALEEEKSGEAGEDGSVDEYDAMYDKAVELVMQRGQASTSMLQRAFRIGYNRAARIIDVMEREGIVGPMDGVKPRDVLVQSES